MKEIVDVLVPQGRWGREEVFKVFSQARFLPHRVVCLTAEVLSQSRVPASPSSSELGSHQIPPARESDESGGRD